MPDPTGGPAAALLDERSRPQGGKRMFVVIVALASGAAGFWLTQAIDPRVRPGLPLAAGIGLGIALGVVYFAMKGMRVTVDAERRLTYHVQGRAALRLPLSLLTAVRPVSSGLVAGVGLELSDPARVEFLGAAGIDAARLGRWRADLGVDIVLEGFPPALAERLDALRKG